MSEPIPAVTEDQIQAIAAKSYADALPADYAILFRAIAEHDAEVIDLRALLQLATNNAAACMRVANERQEQLNLAKEALRWCIDHRPQVVRKVSDSSFVDFLERPPTHLRATIESVMGEKR